MNSIDALKRVDETLRHTGAGSMRIAVNGPGIGEVVSRALQPGATDSMVKDAIVLAGMALDQYRATPEQLPLISEAQRMLRLVN